jgi:hypothetical protein
VAPPGVVNALSGVVNAFSGVVNVLPGAVTFLPGAVNVQLLSRFDCIRGSAVLWESEKKKAG